MKKVGASKAVLDLSLNPFNQVNCSNALRDGNVIIVSHSLNPFNQVNCSNGALTRLNSSNELVGLNPFNQVNCSNQRLALAKELGLM